MAFSRAAGMSVLISRGSDEIEGSVELLAEDFLRAVTGEGLASGQEFEGGDAVGEDIDAMIDRFMADLFGRHVGRRARVAGHLAWFVGFPLGEIEVDEAQVAVAGEDDILRFEIEVHESAFMHMFERQGHIDEDIADMFGEDGIVAGAEKFEVGALDVFHEEEEIAFDLAVGDVGDDVFVVMDPGQDLAATNEAAFRDEVEPEIVVKAPEGMGLALGIGGQPDIGHAATVDEFLEVIGPELSGLGQWAFMPSEFSKQRHVNGYRG
jgi:hypothetical protein